MAWRNSGVGENLNKKQIRHAITFQKTSDVLYSPSESGIIIGGPNWLQTYIDSVKSAKETALLLSTQMWATFGNTDEHIEVFDPE